MLAGTPGSPASLPAFRNMRTFVGKMSGRNIDDSRENLFPMLLRAVYKARLLKVAISG